tara:strand:+ start:1451 stop:1615 length:165 start_codon:yes stop_codon:yes gene_type:complete
MEIHQVLPKESGTGEFCPDCGKMYFARKFWIKSRFHGDTWQIAESQAPTKINGQ